MRRSVVISIILALCVLATAFAAETFEFQAEVSSMMNIIVHSLYSEKEVFLREVLSNSADALDKLRYLKLTEPESVDGGELAIWLTTDKDANQLIIEDNGIGMSHDTLVQSLGTIAESGTKKFIQALQAKDVGMSETDLIGQFGVGFYSVFLVADKVTVDSVSHEGGQAHRWTSEADSGAFSVEAIETDMKRGTRITLHLRDDSLEYLSTDRIEDLIFKYSEFLAFPIYVWKTPEPEPVDDAEEAPGPVELEPEFTRINTKPVLWRRAPEDVTTEEYQQFFKDTVKDARNANPLAWLHFTGEGDVSFTSLVFIPETSQLNQFDSNQKPPTALRLFAKRVYIGHDHPEMLPAWASFVRGIVDCDDMELNVSRELVQGNRQLRAIGRRITFNVIQKLKKMATEAEEAWAAWDPEEADDEDTFDVPDYYKFWNAFGKHIKIGIIQDEKNKDKLLDLVRIHTTGLPRHDVDKDGPIEGPQSLTTLQAYTERALHNQTKIFYVGGENLDELTGSPFLEKLLDLGIEVLLLDDPLDEYMVQAMPRYVDEDDGEWTFVNVAKDDLDLTFANESTDEANATKLHEGIVSQLINYLSLQLAHHNVQKVVTSSRLTDSAAVIVSPGMSLSANQQRLMRAQSLSDPRMLSLFEGMKRVLEINVDHPVVKNMAHKVALAWYKHIQTLPEEEWGEHLMAPAALSDATLAAEAELMYETAMIQSGFPIKDSHNFSTRVYNMLAENLINQVEAENYDEAERLLLEHAEAARVAHDAPVVEEPVVIEEEVVEEDVGHDEL